MVYVCNLVFFTEGRACFFRSRAKWVIIINNVMENHSLKPGCVVGSPPGFFFLQSDISMVTCAMAYFVSTPQNTTEQQPCNCISKLTLADRTSHVCRREREWSLTVPFHSCKISFYLCFHQRKKEKNILMFFVYAIKIRLYCCCLPEVLLHRSGLFHQHKQWTPESNA